MTTTAKLVAGLVLLIVLAPVVIGFVQAVFVPVVVLVVLGLIARVVWFFTSL
jgi:hypothetical protein